MKRMVKNGDLLDISEEGSAMTFGGNLKVGGTIIANGEIRGGDVSASKFYLGTEEMPLVKANPAGDAAGTLEKIKIGNVAYKVGGGSGDRELTINLDYSSNENSYPMSVTLPEDTINKIDSVYYDKIRFFYNDGNPAATFLGTKIYFSGYDGYNTGTYKGYVCQTKTPGYGTPSKWYGKDYMCLRRFKLSVNKINKTILIEADYDDKFVPILDQSKFDALYKLADKPTGDGTYVLKATVSGGAVTYTWVAE